jgi:hypothetical protein
MAIQIAAIIGAYARKWAASKARQYAQEKLGNAYDRLFKSSFQSSGPPIASVVIFSVAFLSFLLMLAVAGSTASPSNLHGVDNPREPGVPEGPPGDPGDLPPATGDCAGIANLARAELGVVEVSENYAPRIMEYTDNNVEQWCADFVSWVLWQSGNRLDPSRIPSRVRYSRDPSAGRENNVLNLQRYFNQYEIGFSRGSAVQAGDLVFYDWSRCGRQGTTHTGIVVSFDAGTGMMTTVEGNMGIGLGREGVGSRSISVTSPCIIGFGRLRNCQSTQGVMEYLRLAEYATGR